MTSWVVVDDARGCAPPDDIRVTAHVTRVSRRRAMILGMRVLVVEDEPRLADAIVRVLRGRGIAADAASDGEAALDRVAGDDYDVVVLDRNLPRLAGDEVCRRLVAVRSATRILMLTARDAIEDRVEGLDLGADDYVPKPVAMAELVARVRALGRRRGGPRPPVLAWGDLRLDAARRLATRAGEPLALARREFAVLEELMGAEGAVVSADRLLTSVWDDAYEDPFANTVRVTVMRLRRKLGEPSPIETVVGSGYRMR
jgi:DNA-binding response OmpR family regulator